MTLIQHILESARRRLAVLGREASIFDAAEILADPNIPIVIVCDGEGMAAGVISRTDIIKAISHGRADACSANADAIMNRAVFSCRADQTLQSVWTAMNERGLRCAPVLDDFGRPQGVVHARDLASALFNEVTNEEELLRDYVVGIGYQ